MMSTWEPGRNASTPTFSNPIVGAVRPSTVRAKASPMMANSTGLWLPAKGYFVSVNASTKVCDKAQVKKLASKMN